MMFIHVFLQTFLLYQSVLTSDDYRLPKIVLPTNYQLHLILPEEAFTATSNEFSGTVTIQLDIIETTSEIKLHSVTETIINSIQLDDDQIDETRYELNGTTDILTISLDSQLEEGTQHVLRIDYTGTLRTQVQNGFFKVSYTDNAGTTHYVLATQLQPTLARYGFPSFDEPSFKASFDISITYPSELNALCNEASISNTTEDGYTTTVFGTTPVMSSYLVAFVVSDFTCTEGENVEDDLVPYRICSRPDFEGSRDFALEVGPLMMRALIEYTGIKYSDSASKMDQVAVPGTSSGAMENWGLIRYGEQALIWHKDESTVDSKIGIGYLIAHELTHQWFGNLVTCAWWSETFLNEGFAQYLQFYITNHVLPDWEADKQFVIRVEQTVLEIDSDINTQALQSDASNPSEVNDKFGTITYNKGGSVLRMVEHFVGLENFKKGINNYLTIHQYNSTVPEDLWEAIDGTELNLPTDLTTIMENWVQKSGFPLVTASLEGNVLTLSQERFLFTETNSETKWYVPISYTTSSDPNNFENTTPKAWLTPENDLVITFEEEPEWVVINNQQTGYYRVNYDEQLWKKLSEALQQENFSGIHEVNRAQIVNDVFNLASLGRLTYSQTFEIIDFLKKEESYIVWYPAFNKFETLLNKIGLNTKLGVAVAEHVLELSENLRRSVSLTNVNTSNHVYTLKQILANSWSCKLGSVECELEAQEHWDEYKSDPSVKPDVNIRNVVYCNGIRYSTNPLEDFKFLLEQYENDETDKTIYLNAIGCSKDETVLNEYLQKGLTEINNEHFITVFSSVNDVDVAFKFFVDNYDLIFETLNNSKSVENLLKNIADKFTTETQTNLLRSYIENGTFGDLETAHEALATAESNLAWLEEHKEELTAYYELTEGETTTESTESTYSTDGTSEGTTERQTDTSASVKTSSIAAFVIFCLIFVL